MYCSHGKQAVAGVSAFLQDVTNTDQQQIPRSKRTCSDRAVAMVKQLSHTCKIKCAPRGRHAVVEASIDHQHGVVEASEDYQTLKKVIDSRHNVIEQGVKRIQQYTERNTTFVMQKAFAIQLFGCLVLQGKGIIAASEYAATCSSFHARTIRKWARNVFVDYFSTAANLDDITDYRLELELESSRGKHPKWFSLLADENLKGQLKKYVLDNGYVKGRPNLTLQMVIDWVKESEGVEICKSTASLWLHDLGFTYEQFSKGVYFDGHERDDVVESRKVYLDTLDSLRHRMWVSHSPRPDPLCRPVIRIFHDESTYYANADQSYHWTNGTSQALKQKSLGQSVMVSDFIEEVNGFLKYESEEARLLLEHQSEGYFNNDKLVEQVERAIDIFERKYPGVQGVFIFDHAPSHMKRPDDALNPEKMNVKDGGKQPFMRDTVWRGCVQRMVTDEGVQKGMRSRVKCRRETDDHGYNCLFSQEEKYLIDERD